MHKKEFITAGQDLKTASRVLIMIHGRGANAEDILGLSDHLESKWFCIAGTESYQSYLVSLFIPGATPAE